MKYSSKGEEGEGYTPHVGVTEYFRCWQEGRGLEEGQGRDSSSPRRGKMGGEREGRIERSIYEWPNMYRIN